MKITNPLSLRFPKNLINYKFIATGGVAPYKFKTALFPYMTMPPGLTLTLKGILKGTPTSEVGSAFNIRLKAIDSNGQSVFKQFVIVIDAPTTTTTTTTTPAPLPSFWSKPISGSVTYKDITRSIASFELANQNQTIPPSVYWESGRNQFSFNYPSFYVGIFNNIPIYTVEDNLGGNQFAFGSRPITPNTTQTYTDSDIVSPFISVTIQWGDSISSPT